MSDESEAREGHTPTPDDALATDGFCDGDLYQSGRPGYSRVAVDFLIREAGVKQGSFVVDLAAGTGLFTRALVGRCGRIEAVEPSASMRAAFSKALPNVVCLDGSATHLPQLAGSVDAVFVAQAFHWFDQQAAMTEISRVLTDGGALGLVWNERDESVDWVRALSEVMEWPARQPYDVGMDFAPILESGPFRDIRRLDSTHTVHMTRDGLVQRVATTSYIVAMTEAERAALMARVRRFCDDLPERVALPYVCTAYVATHADTET